MSEADELLWSVRAFIYAQFAETTRPPTPEETAQHFGITAGSADSIYRELGERHALFLEPGTSKVMMAFPFSGVPTGFIVETKGKAYFANCAWDMLGIPAALHSDAIIRAACAESQEPIQLEIRNGNLLPSEAKIHFLLPFARWYDDLPYT